VLSLTRRNPEFRRLFLAHTVSRSGDAFNTVALVVLVFELTGSGRGVAAVAMFEVLPVLLIGPIAGFAADKVSRRHLMVGADLVRAGAAAALLLAAASLPAVFAVALVLSAAAVVFNPAASSLVADVVDSNDLITANSALWSAAVVAQVIFAPLAGVVIAASDVRTAFAINSATFVVSAALLIGLRSGRAPATIEALGWSGALGGVRVVRRHPLLRRLLIVQVLAALSAGATSGLLVVLAQQRLGVGPGGFGLLLAAIGVGAAMGPVLLRRFIKVGDRRWLFGPYLLRGGVDVALATVTSPAIAGSALVVYGVSTSTGMVAYQSTVQGAVPAEIRGRSLALFDVAWNGARLVSLAAGGIIADAVDVRWVYFGAAGLLFAAALVGFAAPLDTHQRQFSSR
jgi:MFS family permease